MYILSVKLDGWHNIVLYFNWFAVIILFLLTLLALLVMKRLYKKVAYKTIKIEEAKIGIGNSSVTIKYDGSIKEIAYKIWIELTTRKIGIQFDENYDVISEVYDSWYEAFRVIRTLLEEVPANRLSDAKGLIELTTKVLNNGLRPHLTKWQAKYRAWYKNNEGSEALNPQEKQREFPEYQSLVDDLKKANSIMIKYADELKRLIDE